MAYKTKYKHLRKSEFSEITDFYFKNGKDHIIKEMVKRNWRRKLVARVLCIHERTIYKQQRKYLYGEPAH